MRRSSLKLSALIALCLLLLALQQPKQRAEAPQIQSRTVPLSWEPIRERWQQKLWDESRWMLSEAAKLEGNTRAMAAQEARQGGSHRGYGSVEACIAAVENGGDYGRSSNPSHFGKYQFSRGTWAANGGNPDTWGYASPEEQEAVFRTTVERNGYRDWTPYDGCG